MEVKKETIDKSYEFVFSNDFVVSFTKIISVKNATGNKKC